VSKKTCKGCGTPLIGRAYKWCDECRPGKSNRKVIAEIARANGDHERAEKASGSKGSKLSATVDYEAWGALLLASGLAITDDLDRARRLAGLPEVSDEQLEELETEARQRWPDVIEMRTEGFQRVGFLLAQTGMIQLMPQLAQLPANQVAPAVKSVVDALEKIQNGVSPSFGDFNVNVKVVKKSSAS